MIRSFHWYHYIGHFINIDYVIIIFYYRLIDNNIIIGHFAIIVIVSFSTLSASSHWLDYTRMINSFIFAIAAISNISSLAIILPLVISLSSLLRLPSFSFRHFLLLLHYAILLIYFDYYCFLFRCWYLRWYWWYFRWCWYYFHYFMLMLMSLFSMMLMFWCHADISMMLLFFSLRHYWSLTLILDRSFLSIAIDADAFISFSSASLSLYYWYFISQMPSPPDIYISFHYRLDRLE